MKLVQCISEFIFPTENHLVICSAHERKAPGHLKVDHISALTMHFPFLNIGVKSLIFLSTSLFCIPPCRLIPVFSLSLSLSFCLYVLLSWIFKSQCVGLSIKLSEPAHEQGIPSVPVFMWVYVWKNVGIFACICVCGHKGMFAHTCACVYTWDMLLFSSLSCEYA